MASALTRGTVALIELDPVRGHGQAGFRPCVVVSTPQIAQHQKYPLVAVVPLTRTAGSGLFYPKLPAGTASLLADSHVLTDHLRSIDKSRIRRIYGVLDALSLARVDQALRVFMGLMS